MFDVTVTRSPFFISTPAESSFGINVACIQVLPAGDLVSHVLISVQSPEALLRKRSAGNDLQDLPLTANFCDNVPDTKGWVLIILIAYSSSFVPAGIVKLMVPLFDVLFKLPIVTGEVQE